MQKARKLANESFLKGVRESTDLHITSKDGETIDNLKVLMGHRDLAQFRMVSDSYTSHDGNINKEGVSSHKKAFKASC